MESTAILGSAHTKTSPAGTAYRIHGTGAKTLFFAHGVGLNQHIWQPQIEAFSTHYTVVAYDLLGHGDSPMPRTDASIEDYVDQLEALRNHLDIAQIAVIGHSTGALISIGYALKHSDRTTHIAPLNAIYCRPLAAQAAALERMQDAIEHGPAKQIDTTLSRWFGDGELSTDHHQKRDNLREWLKQANIAGYGITYRLFVESDRLYVGRLNQIQCPALFLTGELDPNSTPDMSIEMANEVDGASCAVIADSRHMTPYVDADKTNTILTDFLASS